MFISETAAYGVFAGYFGLILFSLVSVVRSIGHGVPLERFIEQKPFLFIRLAIAALFATWYCESILLQCAL